MKRMFVIKRNWMVLAALATFIGSTLMAQPAMAIPEFGKQWKSKYLGGDDVDPDFKNAGRKANCNVCHIKGEKKNKRNDYGEAVHKFLDKKNFSKDYVKSNPDEAKAKILEGFKKAAEEKAKDGETFGAKLKENKLPATNAGI